MKNTRPEDILPKRVLNHTQYKHARGFGREYRVLSVDADNKTFTGEDCKRKGNIHSGLKIADFYFFEFV